MTRKKNLIFAAGCVVLTIAVALLVSLAKPYLAAWRFNYESVRQNQTITWAGPREGEKIELSELRNEKGEPFPHVSEKSLMLLSIEDPKCQMCQLSTDLIERIRSEAESHQVKFFVVSFVSESSKEEFFRYANRLCDAGRSYYWQGSKDSVLPALRKMVVPSHLLIDENGKVIRRFPGSAQEKPTREQMARQIIRETLEAKTNLN